MSAQSADDHLWFLDTLVAIRVAAQSGADAMSVLEHRAPQGDSPPLHLHQTEDEIFVLLDGTLRFRVAGDERLAHPGDVVLAPQGVAHTYRVESDEARWLTVTAKGDFERFVRAVGRVAERRDLPVRGVPPSPEAIAALAQVAAQHGIELVGPPLA